MDDEDQPDPIAELDQALRGLIDLGRVFRAHYEAMVAAGFTEPQAFALTLNHQTLTYGAARA